MATTTAAYPWRNSSVDEGETAPGGPDVPPARLSSRRSDAEIKEEYSKLREAGMPLDSMKLVLNEDLSAVRAPPQSSHFPRKTRVRCPRAVSRLVWRAAEARKYRAGG